MQGDYTAENIVYIEGRVYVQVIDGKELGFRILAIHSP